MSIRLNRLQAMMHRHSAASRAQAIYSRVPYSFRFRGAGCLLLALVLSGAGAARAESAGAVVTPKDAATGFIIEGPINVAFSTSAGLTIDVAAIINNSSKTQGLGLHLWATPASQGVPTYSPVLDFSDLGGIDLGNLGPGKQITNIARAGLTYTPPPAGCYYLTLALLNSSLQTVDLFILSKGGVATPSGYDLYAFGKNATCAQTTSCTQNAIDGCLLSNRFLVTTTYYNGIGGKAQGQVLSFGGTRAESDESVFYYFTDPTNFEMAVKVLNACGVNNSFWVFIGGLTNQGWEVNITDTQTGTTKYYNNVLNNLTVTTADTAAFACP